MNWFSSIAANDERTRRRHAAMHGQTVGQHEIFTLPSGETAHFPLDDSLSASECINCRCIIIFVVRSSRQSENYQNLVAKNEDITYTNLHRQALEENEDFNRVNPTAASTDPVENALGIKQNVPIDVAQAAKETNPKFLTGGDPYTNNCQRCVQAYELRRRGYNVEAKPSPSLPPDMHGNEIFTNKSGGSIPMYFGLSESDVKNHIGVSGDGARHVVYAKWNNDKAHVFIAENIGGTTQYIDPQSGKLDVSGHFASGKPNEFGLWRVDNADITSDSNLLNRVVEVTS